VSVIYLETTKSKREFKARLKTSDLSSFALMGQFVSVIYLETTKSKREFKARLKTSDLALNSLLLLVVLLPWDNL